MNRPTPPFQIVALRDRRRGITLLFVVSLIVLFLLMGTAFVIVSNDFYSAARKRSDLGARSESGSALLERAFYEFVRGPSLDNTDSPLRGHSLLADQYGFGLTGFVLSATPVKNNQFIEIQLKDEANTPQAINLVLGGGSQLLDDAANPGGLLATPAAHLFNGMVLGFVSGEATGTMTRIVEHRVEDNGAGGFNHILVIAADGADGVNLATAALVDSRVVVNGRAFSGFGAAFNSTTGTFSDRRYVPNYRSFEDPAAPGTNVADQFRTEYLLESDSLNEPYDAADEQNMFLAAVGDVDGDGVPNEPGEIIPSFLRDYLAAAGSNATEQPNRYSFRPQFVDLVNNSTALPPGDGLADPGTVPTANAFFPNILATPRPLDVDNDYDGNLDSVWIDIGMPSFTNEEGKIVKPLVAPLIVDLDGRLNVNAHGNRVALAADQFMTVQPLLGSPVRGATMPLGMGMGPAEISLAPLFPGSGDYTPLLTGNGTLSGRYGVDGVPGIPGFEAWSPVEYAGYPDVVNVFSDRLFSSPLDIHGRFGYGASQELDPFFGVPVGLAIPDVLTSTWDPNGDTVIDPDMQDQPYEMNLLQTTYDGNDNPFGAQELERVLRPFDRDRNMLPNRLSELLGSDSAATAVRNLLTTDSFEVPRAPLLRQLVGGSVVQRTIPQFLQELLEANGVTDPVLRETQLKLLLAPEVLHGMPMNLNRQFGDGADNNGNQIFDEHWDTVDPAQNEAMAETLVVAVGAPGSGTGLDRNNDGVVNAADQYARQIFARHLYVLTWLVLADGNGLLPDLNGDGVGTNQPEDIDLLAQWCINVVDFRDADAIMTPFEYDRAPFDGWNVNGDVSDNEGAFRGVVFGAERPELLISETLAAHNRFTHDLPNFGNSPAFDSEMLPNPTCFVELFAPQYRSSPTARYPREIYQFDGTDNRWEIPLGATDASGAGSPVWRMVFTRTRGQDPTNTDVGGHPTVPGLSGPDTSRRVYFTQPSALVEDGTNINYFYPDASVVSAYRGLAPNGYALVGSSGIEYNQGSNRLYRTTFGRRTDATVDHNDHTNTLLNLNNTRQVTLIPGVGILVQNGDAGTRVRRNCVAIPINRWGGAVPERSFAVSDPIEGYPAALETADGLPPGSLLYEEFDPDQTPGNGDGDGFILGTTLAPTVRDQAVDLQVSPFGELSQEGYHAKFMWVQLQRLANPLAPYNPLTNPYISVDESPIDLTVYNGDETSPSSEPAITQVDGDFKVLERGTWNRQVQPNLLGQRVLWQPELESEPPVQDALAAGATPVPDHYFNYPLTESLGEINATFRDVAYANVAFPELTWNDRPFVSAAELLLVPFGSGRSPVDPTGTVFLPPPGGVNTQRPAATPMAALEMLQRFALPDANFDVPTGHLLPFRDLTPNAGGPLWGRLLSYVEVPSPFLNTELYFNPNDFGPDGGPNATGYSAPYNYMSRHRIPGKININTITNPEVWEALVGPAYATQLTYAELRNARQAGANEFGNPFVDVEVNLAGSLLRPNSANPNDSWVQYNSAASYNNTDRSAVFANAPLMRLGNLATNRSSVFAIWLTIGFFEVDENGLLGAEVGSETGDVKRHRGFWIYDRSIPVAFEPGNDHNVERGILVQSISE